MQSLFTLTSAESKRLIAKAIIKSDPVAMALTSGKLAVAIGTTNAFIVEELTKETIKKEAYTAGVITNGRPCLTNPGDRMKPLLLEMGQRIESDLPEFVSSFSRGDVLIKGANALDPDGNVGILLANRKGGLIGATLPTIKAVGATLIIAVGLEKMIPSVKEASQCSGIDSYDITFGQPVGYLMIGDATVITEVEALSILWDVKATPIAAGGTGGSEGSITFVIRGRDENVKKAMDMILTMKGETSLKSFRRRCKDCPVQCGYSGD